jgi:PncC family amidohydrolase
MNLTFEKAVNLLKAKGLTVTFAESCTGGLLGKSITDVPGASAVFHGGAITYSNDIKIKVTGVSPDTIDKYTEVSFRCAEEMAAGAARLFGADIGISATGYAGPGGGTDENPVGTVYTGVYARGKICSYRLYYPGKSRDEIRRAVTLFSAYLLECEADRL